MSLQKLLLSEYKQHPSFIFSNEQFIIDDALIDSFNNEYLNLYRYASNLSRNSFLGSMDRCVTMLNNAFLVLHNQTSDKMESRFLMELSSECEKLIRRELAFARISEGCGANSLKSSGAVRYAYELNKDCYCFGRLDADTLNEINEIAKLEVRGLYQVANAGAYKRNELTISEGRSIKNIRNVLNRFYSMQGILDGVSSYMGCRMEVWGLALELSVSQSGWWRNTLKSINNPPETLYAHLDESSAHPKSIVYLSDVAEEQGPTSVYPKIYEKLHLNALQDLVGRIVGVVGLSPSSPLYAHYDRMYHQSFSSENFRKHYMRLPDKMKFNSHCGWDILPGGAVEKEFVEAEERMLGPAGTFVVFDGGRLMHRGGLIAQGSRIALQVIFADAHLGRRIVRRFKKEN